MTDWHTEPDYDVYTEVDPDQEHEDDYQTAADHHEADPGEDLPF